MKDAKMEVYQKQNRRWVLMTESADQDYISRWMADKLVSRYLVQYSEDRVTTDYFAYKETTCRTTFDHRNGWKTVIYYNR